MITKLLTHNNRTGQSHVRGGFINVDDDVHTDRSVPIPDPHSLRHMPLLNYKIKLLSNPAEPIKRRSILLNTEPFLLEIT